MDKYEYKVCSEEIKKLIQKKKYAEAMKIADTIDWRKVRSVNMLCTISDLYKVNRHYEESRDILLMAYEKNPNGEMILYSLCELSLKLNDIVMANEYYKEFMKIAPQNNGGLILLYKIYETIEAKLEDRIEVLEELKKREYREKWAYELAYLYHRVGLSTKCVEECDELILWFGEGRYVTKAMELKMLHAPLTPEQEVKFNKAKGIKADQPAPQPSAEVHREELDIEVKPINVGDYATINLQKELAESLQEVLNSEAPNAEDKEISEEQSKAEAEKQDADTDEIRSFSEEAALEEDFIEAEEDKKPKAPEKIKEKKEKETQLGDFTREIMTNLMQTGTEELTEIKVPDEKEVFFEEQDTTDIPKIKESEKKAFEEYQREPEKPTAKAAVLEENTSRVVKMNYTGEVPKIIQKETANPSYVMPSAQSMAKEKNEAFDKILSQESNGQISLAIEPESKPVEKQITGQMSINDILAEWERRKEESKQKREEAVRKQVKQQTGEIFERFDESTKQGILGELDEMARESMAKEKRGDLSPDEKRKIKDVVDMEEESSIKDTDKAPEPKEEEPVKKQATLKDEEEIQERARRQMTPEERKLFGQFIQTKSTRNQIIDVLDNISLASCTGNVILTGEPGMDTVKLAKNIIVDIQTSDSNFSGKVAKITGQALNNKDVEKMFARVENGALIIESAGNLKDSAISSMTKLLEQDKQGIIVILEDTKITMNKLLDNHEELLQNFNLRIDVDALDNDSLVLFAKRYALEKEFTIDELAILALYTRISEMQTSEHSVTTKDIKEIIDEAIEHAEKKSVSHFVDVLFGKRYDSDDMIILREKDFV